MRSLQTILVRALASVSLLLPALVTSVPAQPVDAAARMRQIGTILVGRIGADRAVETSTTLVSDSGSTIPFVSLHGPILAREAILSESGPDADYIDTLQSESRAISPIIEHLLPQGGLLDLSSDFLPLQNARVPNPFGVRASEFYSFTARVTPEGGTRIDLAPRSDLYPALTGAVVIGSGSIPTITAEFTIAPPNRLALLSDPQLRLESGPGRTTIRMGGELVISVLYPIATLRGNVREMQSVSHPLSESASGSTPVQRDRASLTNADSLAADLVAIDYPDRTPSAVAVLPYLAFDRVESVSLGIAPALHFGPVTFASTGYYSFGLDRLMGSAEVDAELLHTAPWSFGIMGRLYSDIATTTTGDKHYPRIMNTLVAAGLHSDYYDYLRRDGGAVGVTLGYGIVNLTATASTRRDYSLPVTTNRSLLSNKPFRPNPPAEEGSYRTLLGRLDLGANRSLFDPRPLASVAAAAQLNLFGGRRESDQQSFWSIEALGGVTIPLIYTGYDPVSWTLLASAGLGSASLPPQYQFRLRTSAATIGDPGGFVSPPTGVYGGTRYVAVGSEINLSDFPWRAMGLPRWKGRGLDLILAGTSGRFQQEHSSGYAATDGWYSEVGFGISRIPLFLTDLIAGRVDLRWGVGETGRFYVNLTLVGPF